MARLGRTTPLPALRLAGVEEFSEAVTYQKAGALIAGGLLRGASQSGLVVRTGAVTTAGRVSGTDVFTAVEAGAVASSGRLSGPYVRVSPSVIQKTGALAAGTWATASREYLPSAATGSIDAATGGVSIDTNNG